MKTYDGVVHIHHEADWSSTALVQWHAGTGGAQERVVTAQSLWDDSGNWPATRLPVHIEVRAVRLATRGRVKWEHDQVLSRPVPGRVMLPWSERMGRVAGAQGDHDPTDAWMFDHSLSTKAPISQRRDIPLGWVENVAIAMSANGLPPKGTAVLIDIGAPHRDPCTCGGPFLHERACPQFDTFPRIGRLYINLDRVDRFIETLQAARTTTNRVFVPDATTRSHR